jgi:hypothetical protein
MLTRGNVTHQYGYHPANYSPAPHHVIMREEHYPAPTSRAALIGHGGGLMGGAVSLATRGWTGSRLGNTGYGYLGLDPSDPQTWVVRPFVPTRGMISYLNFGA